MSCPVRTARPELSCLLAEFGVAAWVLISRSDSSISHGRSSCLSRPTESTGAVSNVWCVFDLHHLALHYYIDFGLVQSPVPASHPSPSCFSLAARTPSWRFNFISHCILSGRAALLSESTGHIEPLTYMAFAMRVCVCVAVQLAQRGYCDAYTEPSAARPLTSPSSSSRDVAADENAQLVHEKRAPLILTEPDVNTIRFSSSEQRAYFDAWAGWPICYIS